MLQFRRPISDCHIHLFNPAQIQECFDMVKTCGYDHWTFLGCTLIGSRALTQNLMGALLKLKGQGQCLAYASFHYDSMQRRMRKTSALRSRCSTRWAMTASKCSTASRESASV